jgi:hypothetical protein
MADQAVLQYHDLQIHPPLAPLEVKTTEPTETSTIVEPYTCCGINCRHVERVVEPAREKPKSNCGPECMACCGDIFGFHPWAWLRFLVIGGMIAVGAWLVRLERPTMMACNEFISAYRYECFQHIHLQSLQLYAFGIWLLVLGCEFFLWNIVHTCHTSFEERTFPNRPRRTNKYECVNGVPNKALRDRLCFWFLLLLHWGFLYVALFYGPIMNECKYDRNHTPLCDESLKEVAAVVISAMVSGAAFLGSCKLSEPM